MPHPYQRVIKKKKGTCSTAPLPAQVELQNNGIVCFAFYGKDKELISLHEGNNCFHWTTIRNGINCITKGAPATLLGYLKAPTIVSKINNINEIKYFRFFPSTEKVTKEELKTFIDTVHSWFDFSEIMLESPEEFLEREYVTIDVSKNVPWANCLNVLVMMRYIQEHSAIVKRFVEFLNTKKKTSPLKSFARAHIGAVSNNNHWLFGFDHSAVYKDITNEHLPIYSEQSKNEWITNSPSFHLTKEQPYTFRVFHDNWKLNNTQSDDEQEEE